MSSSRIAVVGGGVVGLCIATALRRRGFAAIDVFESGTWPNPQGSSHGTSRITRSAYSSAFYVELMQRAHGESWPGLEALLGCPLIHPCDGLFFGPEGGLIERYAEAVRLAGADVESLPLEQARRRFPAFSFEDDERVLFDRTAAVVAAETTVLGLVDWLRRAGVRLHPHTRVRALEPQRVCMASGTHEADVVVCCAGPWTAQLVPELSGVLVPFRQRVFYLEPRDASRAAVSDFPVWVEIGQTIADTWYGLPSFGRPGLKVARHRLDGVPDDPDASVTITAADRDRVLRRAGRRIPLTTGRILHEELCIYTFRENEDFLIDWVAPGVIVAGGFSGHGFKLAPLCGELVADLVQGGRALEPFALAS